MNTKRTSLPNGLKTVHKVAVCSFFLLADQSYKAAEFCTNQYTSYERLLKEVVKGLRNKKANPCGIIND